MSIAIELIVKSKLPLEQFGVTTKNWKPAVIQGVMVAVMLMGVGIALKYVLVKMHIYTSVFSYHHIDTHLIWLPLYILFVPIQELIVRGAIQGALYELVSDKERNRVIGSILLSNFMFSSFHAHISLFFVVIIFIPSVIWGYLYYRHKTLIGVTVSHILSGTFAIYALGFGF